MLSRPNGLGLAWASATVGTNNEKVVTNQQIQPVNKGIRLINCLVDLVVVFILTAVLFALTQQPGELLLFGCSFIYYWLLESLSGKTIGKLLTKTTVVDGHGQRPNKARILLRTVLRFYPFDTLSFLFGKAGAHDVLSKTYLKADQACTKSRAFNHANTINPPTPSTPHRSTNQLINNITLDLFYKTCFPFFRGMPFL